MNIYALLILFALVLSGGQFWGCSSTQESTDSEDEFFPPVDTLAGIPSQTAKQNVSATNVPVALGPDGKPLPFIETPKK